MPNQSTIQFLCHQYLSYKSEKPKTKTKKFTSNTLLLQTIVCKTISYLLFHYSYLNAPINTEEILGINTEKLLAYFVIIHDINISNQAASLVPTSFLSRFLTIHHGINQNFELYLHELFLTFFCKCLVIFCTLAQLNKFIIIISSQGRRQPAESFEEAVSSFEQYISF